MPRKPPIQQVRLPCVAPDSRPFVKWVGGKRRLIKRLQPFVPEQFGRYHEPFVGGGALFFHLASRRPPATEPWAVLSDANTRLIRTYRAVRDEFADRNIEFTMFNSNIQDNLPRIAKEAGEFGIDFPIMKDEGQHLAKALGVERTAEVFIVNPRTREVLFRGPINDQLGYETQRNEASEHYLKDALNTVLAGGAVNMDDIPDSKGCLVAIFDT